MYNSGLNSSSDQATESAQRVSIKNLYVPIGMFITAVIMTITVMLYFNSFSTAIERMATEMEQNSSSISRLVDELAIINDHSIRINTLEIQVDIMDEVVDIQGERIYSLETMSSLIRVFEQLNERGFLHEEDL